MFDNCFMNLYVSIAKKNKVTIIVVYTAAWDCPFCFWVLLLLLLYYNNMCVQTQLQSIQTTQRPLKTKKSKTKKNDRTVNNDR